MVQSYSDFRALDPSKYIDDVSPGRTATIVIAASNASLQSKAQADFVCDGIHDVDTIRAALAALSAGRTWKEKVALEGDFEISAAIEIPSFTVLDLTDARMKLANGTNGAMWVVTNKTDVNIVGGIFDGNKAHQTSGDYLILAGSSTRISFAGLTINNTTGAGIALYDCIQVDVKKNNIKNGDAVAGIIVVASATSPSTCRDIFITENYLEAVFDAAIQIGGFGYTIKNIQIKGNIIRNPTGSGIRVYSDSVGVGGAQEIIVEGNIITNDNVPSVNGVNIGVELAVSTTHGNIVIRGNIVRNFNYAGIRFESSASKITVEGNTVENCWHNNLKFAGLVDSVISDNIIHNVLETGIHTSGIELHDSFRNIIRDNRVFDDQVSPQMKYGVWEDGTSDYNTIEGNTFNVVTAGVAKVGSHTVVRDNQGYVTENSGTATIVAGATSIVVAHGLAATPTRVILTPTTDTAGRRPWVSAKAAANFTITIDSLYAADIIFDWKAQVGEG